MEKTLRPSDLYGKDGAIAALLNSCDTQADKIHEIAFLINCINVRLAEIDSTEATKELNTRLLDAYDAAYTLYTSLTEKGI